MYSVTGARSTTVVTLSTSADRTAQTTDSTTRSRNGSPPATLTERMASHWKKPVRRRMAAITIIPDSRKMTFRSIAPKASSWSTMPSRTTAVPPRRAAIVLSIRSVAMRAYVATKMTRVRRTTGSIVTSSGLPYLPRAHRRS